MKTLHVDIKDVLGTVSQDEINKLDANAASALDKVLNGTGAGSDFLGWVNLPTETTDALLDDIVATAEALRRDCDTVVAIGIGGSYLGAKAVIEALSDSFAAYRPAEQGNPKVLFAGQNIGEDYLYELQDYLKDKRFGIIVISKSGTTTEPAIAFRLLKEQLERQLGLEEARKRIVAITDAQRGALRRLATEEGYKTFVIADNVGGRYSVLTPVGLLPIAVAGFDIRALIDGAAEMEKMTNSADASNPAYLYAETRNALYQAGKKTEILVNYNPKLHFFGEWWKQLYGESEGKDNLGIFPAAVEANLDGLNYIAGKHVDEVNKMAELGTRLAHVDGGVPNILVTIPALEEKYLGQLIYFFEKACGISGYILGINPFNQPGVEAYKRNMFALLEKPGYEKETEAIKARI